MRYDDGRDLIIILLEVLQCLLKGEKKISTLLKKNKPNTKTQKE